MTIIRKTQGFSLVEVLIALIIMSVGMLGIAGLYVQSMKAGRTSILHHHAVTLAGDIADRIRANPLAGDAYTQTPGADNGCVTGNKDCEIAEMADQDIFLWRAQALEFLPAMADGSEQIQVTYDGGVVPPTYTVTIRWDEPTLNDTGPAYSINVPVNQF